MSADNWAICHKCMQKFGEMAKELKLAADNAYGKVPVADFEKMRNAAREYEAELLEQTATLREDYRVGIQDGEFSVSYSAHCVECGFEFKYNFEKEV